MNISLLPASEEAIESREVWADFDQTTLPWVDRDDFETELGRRLLQGQVKPAQAKQLKEWRNNGFVIFRNALPETLVDQAVSDYERLWVEKPLCRVQVGGKPGYLSDLPDRFTAGQGARVLDFHNTSEASKHLMLYPDIVEFVRLVLGDTPVGMQSLFFEYGSEQALHQDFAYVPSGILSHLLGAWIALEDIGPDQGPLIYVPGSHRVRKFDLDNGELVFHDGNRHKTEAWYAHLLSEMDRMRLSSEPFIANKGDVVLWHAALIHGGSPTLNPQKTRKSFVSHFSSQSAYQRDYRNMNSLPEVISLNGGITYGWQDPMHTENYFSLPRSH